MSILHHITTSPSDSNALACAIRFSHKADTLLLAGNAINALLLPQWREKLQGHHVCVMQQDVVARGLSSLLDTYQTIDYAAFVALTFTHSKVISW
ncbi:sulfurtransferase complex subunit TusB [Shewanella sp. YIC-542]|uniref:sulfurtransferase complex subunit TusB n=1 Tax=Shewanella mytili TaxID=3377111 RepID=UPI00398F5BD6